MLGFFFPYILKVGLENMRFKTFCRPRDSKAPSSRTPGHSSSALDILKQLLGRKHTVVFTCIESEDVQAGKWKPFNT